MCPSLMADTSPSKSSPLWLKLRSSSGHNPTFIIILHILSGSSFNTAQSHLLKYSATIAAEAGPSVRSAQGEE